MVDADIDVLLGQHCVIDCHRPVDHLANERPPSINEGASHRPWLRTEAPSA